MKLSECPTRIIRFEHGEEDQRKRKVTHKEWQEENRPYRNRYLRKWRAKRSRDAGEL